ncbi:MAG: sulfurtransferase [Cyanobacteria bacterium P01_H01_bin.121]
MVVQHQSLHPTSVVSVDWLAAHLNHPQVRIVDCRFALADPQQGRQAYLNSHVPGAVYLDLDADLSSPVQRYGGRHPLPDPEALATKLGAIGIQSGATPTFVVAYDSSRLAFAARLWWLLRYLGHAHVAVLDGGFDQWQQQGQPLSQAIPGPAPVTFTPDPQANQVVNYEYVRAVQTSPTACLIDSREGDRYRGEREPIDPIAGHIPGAVNYFWQDVTVAETGLLKPKEFQQQHWSEVQAAHEPIVYCGSGVTACVNLLSLELAGIKTAKLYAGSWSDWCAHQLHS